MAIVKKLLVKTPVTADGISPVYDENKQPVIKESIVELKAQKHLESMNAHKAKVLQDEFEVVDYDTVKKKVVDVKAEADKKAAAKKKADDEAAAKAADTK